MSRGVFVNAVPAGLISPGEVRDADGAVRLELRERAAASTA